MNISVIGFGSWGTSISELLAGNGHQVLAWTKDQRVIESMKWNENPYYFPGKKLPKNLKATNDIHQATANSDIIIIALPTQSIRNVIRQIEIGDRILINLSKGIEIESSLLVSQMCEELFGINTKFITLSGPTHAEEVIEHVPTNIVAAGKDNAILEIVQQTFTTDYFRVYTNNDLLGVELCGALKNIYAIASGIIDGLGPWDNTKAALITRAIMEISRLGEQMGAARETFMGLAGVGDMIVTCTSKFSRNRHVGEQLGRGKQIEEIINSMSMVAEGVYTSKALKGMLDKGKTEMPIAQKIYQVLYENLDPLKGIGELMSRTPKPEFW